MQSRKFRSVIVGVGCCLALLAPAFGQDAAPTLTSEKINQLLQDLKSPTNSTRSDAANTLGNASVATAAPALVKALKDRDSGVRFMAANALGNIGAASAALPLTEALHDRSNEVRSAAAMSLGNIGPSAVSAAPALVNALNDKERKVCLNAAYALGHLALYTEIEAPMMDGPALTKALTLWQTAQTRLSRIGRAKIDSKARPNAADFEEAQEAVRHLVNALHQEKQAR